MFEKPVGNFKNVFAEFLIEAIKNKYKITKKKTMTIRQGPFQAGFTKEYIKGKYGWPELKRALRDDQFKIARIDILVGHEEVKLILDKGIPTEISKETILENI